MMMNETGMERQQKNKNLKNNGPQAGYVLTLLDNRRS